MARTSTEQVLRTAYDKSRELVDTVRDESRTVYEEARRWVPEHRTAVAVSASAAASVGLVGYLLGRRRRARAQTAREAISAAIARTPEIRLAPIFRFLGLWMLYRVATKK